MPLHARGRGAPLRDARARSHSDAPLEGRKTDRGFECEHSQDRARDAAPSLLLGQGDATIASGCGASQEIHHSQQPMRQQFRFANQGQSRSGRLLADPSPLCKRGLCRFGGRGGRDEPHCRIGRVGRALPRHPRAPAPPGEAGTRPIDRSLPRSHVSSHDSTRSAPAAGCCCRTAPVTLPRPRGVAAPTPWRSVWRRDGWSTCRS